MESVNKKPFCIIDPQLSFQANLIIDNLGKFNHCNYELDRVTDLNNDRMEIWYKDVKTKTIFSINCKINHNLFDCKTYVKYKEKQHKLNELKHINDSFFERIK